MRPPSIWISLGVLAVGLGAVFAGVSMRMDATAGQHTVLMLAPVGLVAIVLSHISLRLRRFQRSLSGAITASLVIALGLMLAALLLAVQQMFISGHDAIVAIASTALAAFVGTRAAQVLMFGVRSDVSSLQTGLKRVGAGERDIVLRTGGNDELSSLATAGNQMISALAAEEAAREASEQARREMIAAVSHDLRTPLTSMQLLIEAIDDGVVDQAEAREYIGTMRIQVGAISHLIDDLFELSRLNAGAITWTLERIELGELIDETVAAIKPEAQAQGITVKQTLSSPKLAAKANPEKLQRVLLNLLQNAIRHTPPDGSVELFASVQKTSEGEQIQIEVADSGSGVEEADKERIFEPFYRGGEQAARTVSGSGLGLAIATAIVEAHGGKLRLLEASANGGSDATGARFQFTLPAA